MPARSETAHQLPRNLADTEFGIQVADEIDSRRRLRCHVDHSIGRREAAGSSSGNDPFTLYRPPDGLTASQKRMRMRERAQASLNAPHGTNQRTTRTRHNRRAPRLTRQ